MSIRLSAKYGLNPAIPLCFFCGEKKNEIILAGAFGGKEAPRNAVWDKNPCDNCAKLMGIGVILISCNNEDQGKDNPRRTGGWCVLKDDAIKRMVSERVAHEILRARVAFVPDEAWDHLGLPRGPIEGVPSSIEEVR